MCPTVLLLTLLAGRAAAAPDDAVAAVGAPEPVTTASAAPTPARLPKAVVGPTVAIATPLIPGKAVGITYGLQAIVPVTPKRWRVSAEIFGGTPLPSFVPHLGGDVGVALVDDRGLGGSLALYARHTFAVNDVAPSTQVGPGLLLVSKVAPTVVITVPFVVWVDAETRAVTPALSVKAVLGVPYGR